MTDTLPRDAQGADGESGRPPQPSQLESLTRPLHVDLHAVFDQSPIGIAVCNAEGRLLDANLSCLRICDFRRVEDALGVDVFGHLDVTPEHRQALLQGNAVEFETSFVLEPSDEPSHPPGPPRRVHAHAKITPLASPREGKPEAYLTHLEDITERKSMQETYQALVEGSLQGLALFQDGRIQFANPRLAEMTGFTVQELQAMDAEEVSRLVHPQDRAMVVERLRQRQAGKRAGEQYAVRFLRKDGELRWTELCAQRVDFGGTPAVQVSCVDITEQKLAREALARSESRYRSLFEESPVSLWEEDYSAVKTYLDELRRGGVEDLRSYLEQHLECLHECSSRIDVIAVNKATLDLYDAESQEDLVEGMETIMGEGSQRTFLEQLLAIAERRPFPQMETVNWSLAGHRLNLLVDMRVVPGHEETYSRVLVSLLDVTERRKMEEALREQDLLTALGQMAAGIAHDFRSLLTTIILHAQMGLRTPGLPSQVTPHLRTIVGESHRASDLIQQILDFSSRSMLDVKTLDLEQIVSRALDDLEPLFPPSVNLVLETHPGPFAVRADPDRIEQALRNLALNARDAIAAHEATNGGEFRVALRRLSVDEAETPPVPDLKPGDWIRIGVSDTGTGMTDEVSKHLFEPFFTTKDVGEGKGLGLPQVYGIVHQHHGVIDFETKPGEGTTFHIYLPACEEDDGDENRAGPVNHPSSYGR